MKCKTLRDEIAIAALNGLLSAPDINMKQLTIAGGGNPDVGFAKSSYQIADAMLAEREKPEAQK